MQRLLAGAGARGARAGRAGHASGSEEMTDAAVAQEAALRRCRWRRKAANAWVAIAHTAYVKYMYMTLHS